MKREELLDTFSQVVGVSKAEAIVSEAETTLGFDSPDSYTSMEVRDLCEEIMSIYDGYVAEIANEVRIDTQAQQRFGTLLESVTDPAVVVRFVDGQPVVKRINSSFADVFGYSESTARGEPLAELIVPPAVDYGMDLWLRDDNGAEREVVRHTADREARTFLLRTAIETTMSGETEGYGIYTDITERIERERDLDMLKQLFSRVFRHNIRNELTVVSGHLSNIESVATDERILDSAQTATSASERLLSHTEKAREIKQLIDDDPDPVDDSLQKLINAALATHAETPDGVDIRVDVADLTVSVISGFETAIDNAIENAIRHNSTPLTVEITTTERTSETVTLQIVDDGHGIGANETAVLNSGDETALAHGSGVGLRVINWYVEKSGGDLTVTGGPNGTTVEITLRKA